MSKYQVRDLHIITVDGTGIHDGELCFVVFDTSTSHTVLSGFVSNAARRCAHN